MSLRGFLLLTCSLLALSSCIIVPEGHGEHDHDHSDYGRRVWRE